MIVSNAAKQAGRDIRELSAEVAIAIGGIVTSIATVGLNLLLERQFDFNFLSLSFWFVIPAGALIGGMCAASGYYAVARLTQTMPSRTLLFSMVAVAASTWFLSKWASYATLTLDDGTLVADLLPFWDYFTVTTESMQLSISTRGNVTAATTGELGILGYAREALQLLGFSVGGFVTYAFLSEVEACDSCRRYAKSESLLNSVSPADFQRMLDEANITLPDLVEQARGALGEKPLEGLSLFLSRCPRCYREWLRPAVVVRSGNDLTTTKLGRFFVDSQMASDLRSRKLAAASSK